MQPLSPRSLPSRARDRRRGGRTRVPAARLLPWALLLLAPLLRAEAAAAQSAETTVVIAVRHAERADAGASASEMRSSPDPDLSEEGRARARCLARSLAEAGVTRVFTTGYARTRQTASPLAETLGLTAEEYDPRALGAFADRVRTLGGVVVVVGHSNTTPDLVAALGGDEVRPIAEDEYDRLYTVFIGEGSTRSLLTRYCSAD